jgi:hypothetical protein
MENPDYEKDACRRGRRPGRWINRGNGGDAGFGRSRRRRGIGYFYTIQDCVDVGEYGRSVGTWGAYICTYRPVTSPNKPFQLSAFYN